MIESKHYNTDFYLDQQDGSYLSAQKIVPIVNAVFKPASVIARLRLVFNVSGTSITSVFFALRSVLFATGTTRVAKK